MEYRFTGLLCCILLSNVKTSLQNDCGELSADSDASHLSEGEDLQLTFTPTVQVFASTRKWYKKAGNTWGSPLIDSQSPDSQTRYQETKEGSNYLLVIPNVSQRDAGTYIVQCADNRNSNSIDVKILGERVEESTSGVCGTLRVQNNGIPVGSRIYIWFNKGYSVVYYIWQHEVNGTFVELTENFRRSVAVKNLDTSVMEIINATSADSGRYRISCRPDSYSNVVTVRVVITKPSQPEIIGLKTFEHCENCIQATPGTALTVECTTSGGSYPISMFLYKNDQALTIQTEKKKDLRFVGKYTRTADQSDDDAIYRCTVQNEAITVSLVTEARVYLFKNPSTPVFNNPVVKAGKPASVRCATSDGRPQPEVTFKTEDGSASFPLKVAFDTTTRTYAVSSTFNEIVDKTDNGKTISCCVQAYDMSVKTCTEPASLNVTFPPTNVTLEESGYKVLQEQEGAEFELTCTVSESNPPPLIQWTGLKGTKRKIKSVSRRKGTFGWTVTEQLRVIANKSKNGNEIQCTPWSLTYPKLDVKGSYPYNVQYPPDVSIHGHPEVISYQGDTVSLVCITDSNPVAIVTWGNGSDTLLMGNISKGELKLRLENVDMSQTGDYVCSANNGVFPARSAIISLVIKDISAKPSPKTGKEESMSSSIIAIVVCLCLLVLLIVIGLIIRKKWREKRRRRKREDVPVVMQENDLYVHAEVAQAAPPELVEYASVIPKSKRKAPGPPEDEQNLEPEADGGAGASLIYAELELDNTVGNTRYRPKQNADVNERPTEYVTIDFTRRPQSSPDANERI